MKDDRPKAYKRKKMLSFSELGRFKKHILEGVPESEGLQGDEPFLIFGKELHRMMLEPDKKGYPLTASQTSRMVNVKIRVAQMPSLNFILDHKDTKTENWAEGIIHGVPFRGIIDIQNDTLDVCADIKTTGAYSWPKFMMSMNEFNYWNQAVIYKHLTGRSKFMVFGFQTSGAFTTFILDTARFNDRMEKAEDEVQDLTEKYVNHYGEFWKVDPDQTELL